MLYTVVQSDYVFISLSFLGLFAVLVWYKYEILYRYMVLLISILGLWLPVLYLLPYVLIVWRVFVGKNASTDQVLFIGQIIKSDDISDTSDTTSHWVVVVYDQANETYVYTHAVGNVISGEGIKIPFRNMSEDKRRKYRLIEVGSVTRVNRSLKMKNVVDNEMMQSGYSCQEYAIDVAFQLSSSRTYTLVKTMMMLRFRTVAFYSLLLFSAYLCVIDHEFAKFIHPAVITNIFGAMELSRIGTHNTAQVGVWPVVRAYLRLSSTHFIQLFAIFVLIVVLYIRDGLHIAFFTVFFVIVAVRK